MKNETIVLYRPTGKNELALIEKSGFTSFPPRLPEQPIFYPVLNEKYAMQIARDWNAKYNADKVGYVTKFDVRKDFLDKYETKIVGGATHEEYWIPAEDLEEFNRNIIGKIEVIAEFRGNSNKLVKKNIAFFATEFYNSIYVNNILRGNFKCSKKFFIFFMRSVLMKMI